VYSKGDYLYGVVKVEKRAYGCWNDVAVHGCGDRNMTQEVGNHEADLCVCIRLFYERSK
jgi:hypothetical protein